MDFASDELLGLRSVAQENRNAVHGQSSRQPVEDRREQRVQIRFRTEFAAKFQQRPPVVIDRAVEGLVDSLLNPLAHRVKQQRGHHHGQDQPNGPVPGCRMWTSVATPATSAKYIPTTVAAASV